MDEAILLYIDSCIAALREYIDRELEKRQASTQATVVETIQEVVPGMVADIIENTQQQ